MKLGFLIWLTWGLCVTADPNEPSVGYEKPGAYQVNNILLDWKDASRDRVIPVLIYMPKGDGPFPVIIFSHGLGGGREGYAYVGQHWAGWGYACVHLQHPGSDSSVWKEKGPGQAWKEMNTAANAKNAVDRALDVHFALDTLEQMNRQDPAYKGKLDMSKVGMAGHSFGAQTTLAVSGLTGLTGKSMMDNRIRAAIPMSSPAVTMPRLQKTAYKDIRIPCLHLTGTLDNSPIGNTTAADRRIPYDNINGAEQYLVIFNGADHMTFAGRNGIRGDRSKDELFHTYILNSTTAFWQTYLKNDSKAKAWLNKGFKDYLGTHGSFEKKNQPAAKAS